LSNTNYPDGQLYNSYLNEMDGVEDLPDIDTEVVIDKKDPDTWKMKIPTTIVWLQQDEYLLPTFK
jgi:hypothetical protein